MTIFETGVNETTPENDEFKVTGLLPKTQYRFIVLLFYPNRQDPYVWPPDARFVYETDADHPSSPGRPIVTQLRQDIYKVSWEPAKDNGAVILEYALEALVRSPRNTNRVERSVEQLEEDEDPEEMNNTIPTRMDVITTDSQEYVTFDERWDLVYNGTDVYWIIPEKLTFHKNKFRVRARNSCGWGPFSGESDPISEPLLSSQTGSYLMIVMVSICAIVIVFFVLICVFGEYCAAFSIAIVRSIAAIRRSVSPSLMPSCVLFPLCFSFAACRRAELKKKILIDATTTRIPDVELANLRELPRRGNFIHSNNILYSSSPLTDSEIALLPQIRREQVGFQVVA